ncbi:hypothetical protein [Nocardia sp. bgisy118]|uniref:hypothetical protein n=1 Tax=Nocardia sp. bgisy118 TaxID=3413786 RepID=UPI003F49BB2F
MIFRATVFRRGIAPYGTVARSGFAPRTPFTGHRADDDRLPRSLRRPHGHAGRFARAAAGQLPARIAFPCVARRLVGDVRESA